MRGGYNTIICLSATVGAWRVFDKTDFLPGSFIHLDGSACCTEKVNETAAVTAEECATRCAETHTCEAFVFQPSSGSCWIGKAVPGGLIPIPAKDRTSGLTQQQDLGRIIGQTRDEIPGLLTAVVPRTWGIMLGVGQGVFVKQLLASQWNGALYLVDPYIHLAAGYNDPANVDDRTHQLIYEHLRIDLHRQYQHRHVFVRDFSYTFVRTWKENEMPAPAFIYIDNNHAARAVRRDLMAWWDVLAPGGVIAGNMYLDDPTRDIGVKTAVDAFFSERGIPVYTTANAMNPNWVVFKSL